MQLYRKYFKRIIDLSISLVALVLSLPVLLILSVILLFANKGKFLFVQIRPGKNNTLFKIIKFKTMTDDTDQSGNLLSEEYRITPAGKFIRKYSLDEIPQLINVFLGEMSLIGPRPLLPEYLSLYNDFQRRRNEVKPGITGWAQVNGRNAVSWDERFKLDVWYVDNISFGLDCRILFSTIRKVMQNEGGTPKDAVVMKRFMGNE